LSQCEHAARKIIGPPAFDHPEDRFIAGSRLHRKACVAHDVGVEAYPELDSREATEPRLAVENHLLLAYRPDFLFYVSPNHEKLAATIARGFTAAWRDGSYLKLFNTHPYIQNGLKRANLGNRKVIWLDNPFLSDADRAIAEMYWMHW
jgi:hypothetical protein